MSYTNEYFLRLPRGTTIYTIQRHRSKSGMLRVLEAYFILPSENRMLRLVIQDKDFYHRYSFIQNGYLIHGVGFSAANELVRGFGQYIKNDPGYYRYEEL